MPRVFAVNIEGKRFNALTQRGKVEVLAETGNLSDLAVMATNLVFKSDSVLISSRFIEDISTRGMLVGFRKIAPFHDVNTHEAQEVPRNGIDIPTGILAPYFASPTHAVIIYERPITPCDVLDGRIGQQLTLDGFTIGGKVPRHLRLQKTFLVESHFVIHHKTALL